MLGQKEVWGASWPFTMRRGRTALGCEGHTQLNTGLHSSSERRTMLPFGTFPGTEKAILTIRVFMLRAVRMFLETSDNMS